MKHAGQDALNALEKLLEQLRRCPGLHEKKHGIFYRKSSAFLHFHEDPVGLFADLRVGADWKRFPVNTSVEQQAFLAEVTVVTRQSAKRE